MAMKACHVNTKSMLFFIKIWWLSYSLIFIKYSNYKDFPFHSHMNNELLFPATSNFIEILKNFL